MGNVLGTRFGLRFGEAWGQDPESELLPARMLTWSTKDA